WRFHCGFRSPVCPKLSLRTVATVPPVRHNLSMYFALPRMMNATFVYGCIFLSIVGGQSARAQSQTVQLAWGQISGAVSYEIQINPSGHSEKVLAFKSVTTPEAAIELAPGQYEYRVRANSSDGTAGPWSEGQPFEVKTVAIIPTAPLANVI